MALLPMEVQQKTFRESMRRGYDQGEVDDFLDEVVASLTEYEGRARAAEGRAAAMEAEVGRLREEREAVTEALVDARSRAQAVIAEAGALKNGAQIIAPVNKLAPELPIIRHHHEWYNGSGYPDRLVADEIPQLARILHVADAFEAMTAARPYRMTPLTAEQALGELRKFAGIQFDPVVVDAFVRTHHVDGVMDPGRTVQPRPIPLLGQAAATRLANPPVTNPAPNASQAAEQA